MSQDASNAYGYDIVEDFGGGGRYLSLKRKGDKVKVRLLTAPLHAFRYWETGADGKQRTVNFPTKEAIEEALKDIPKAERPKIEVQYGWLVLDREDGEVKIFKGGQSIAGQIKGIATDEESNWGDPTMYDLIITRTEEKPMYYKVTPVNGSQSPITDEEKQKVADANLDLKEEMSGGSASKTHNAEVYGGAVDLETLPPKEEEAPAENTEGKVDVEADDDDDLPF